MPQDISVQILSQTSDNIQKLFDLSTRIDERVKAMQERQGSLDHRIEEIIERQLVLMQRLTILEAKDIKSLADKLEETEEAIASIDKRLALIEVDSNRHNDRWKSIAGFVVQLIWVILAAYLLLKLNLQAPAVP